MAATAVQALQMPLWQSTEPVADLRHQLHQLDQICLRRGPTKCDANPPVLPSNVFDIATLRVACSCLHCVGVTNSQSAAFKAKQ
jgi:hypothetical protein